MLVRVWITAAIFVIVLVGLAVNEGAHGGGFWVGGRGTLEGAAADGGEAVAGILFNEHIKIN